jgi:flagellar basal-body rod protein FlgG
LNGSGPVEINDFGEVIQGTEVVGKLSVVDVANKDSLQKIGNSLYTFKPNQPPEIVNINNLSVKNGFIETSNVNIVKEMTDMIQTQRVFESTQKAISAYDSMSDKLVNVVGKTTA